MNSMTYDVLHILFKRKRLIGLAFVLILAPVLTVIFTRPTMYRGAVRIAVTQSRAYPLLSPKEEGRNLPLNDATLMTTVVDGLKSPGFLHSAAEVLAERG